MDRTKDLLQCLRPKPEEMEWATAGPRKDKSHENRFANSAAKEAQKPLMLLEQYCTEGKILHGHIDDRQGLLTPTSCQQWPVKLSQSLLMICLHSAHASSTSQNITSFILVLIRNNRLAAAASMY